VPFYDPDQDLQDMRKINLAVETLEVQSFVTSETRTGQGTVVAQQQNTQHGQHCGSAFDACNTGLCTGDCGETYSPDACPTEYPEYC
jgi:hypothetical protein